MKPYGQTEGLSMLKPLEVGATKTLQVREEIIPHFRTGSETVILYASDLHLTAWSHHIVDQLCEVVAQTHPSLILLGGDLVDSRRGLPHLATCLHRLGQHSPIWAIPGNHDTHVGVASVQQCVESAGGQWLTQTTTPMREPNPICIDAICQPQTVKAVKQKCYSILCTHNPAIFSAAVNCHYDLVLAGHLHGSQWVFAEHKKRLYPGAFFYRWNGDKFKQNNTLMLVSRGVNDTLPIRWNCPREVIVCRIR